MRRLHWKVGGGGRQQLQHAAAADHGDLHDKVNKNWILVAIEGEWGDLGVVNGRAQAAAAGVALDWSAGWRRWGIGAAQHLHACDSASRR